MNHVDVTGKHLIDGLRTLCAEVPGVLEVRGVGLMIGVEFVHPDTSLADPGAAIAMLEALRSDGLLVGRGGLEGNVLRIAPPMSVTTDEIDLALERFERALQITTATTSAR